MEEKIYFISEAARIVGVEAHVLRYWEEELGLQIPRNSQGKRCYSREDIEKLEKIHYWKEKGMQLKAVKEILEGEPGSPFEAEVSEEKFLAEIPEEEFSQEDQTEAGAWEETEDKLHRESILEEENGCELITIETPSDTIKKFEQILNAMIERALEQNNEKLVREICDAVWYALDEKLEERMDMLVQQELLRELVKEGEAEAAAADTKKKGIRNWWRRRKERWKI